MDLALQKYLYSLLEEAAIVQAFQNLRITHQRRSLEEKGADEALFMVPRRRERKGQSSVTSWIGVPMRVMKKVGFVNVLRLPAILVGLLYLFLIDLNSASDLEGEEQPETTMTMPTLTQQASAKEKESTHT